MPTATEHCSHEGLGEQLWCWWRTSCILEYLGMWTAVSDKHQICSQGRQKKKKKWKLKEDRRTEELCCCFPLLSCHLPIPDQLWPHHMLFSLIPPLTLSSHQASSYSSGKENSSPETAIGRTKGIKEEKKKKGVKKNAQSYNCTSSLREDWWEKTLAQGDVELGGIDKRDKHP